MQVFLSYARADEAVAAEVDMALRMDGHDVFFDRTSLPAGEGFHRPIRERLRAADKLVFLVSPSSMTSGSYTLTELTLAQKKWPNPDGRVLAVMVEPTPFAAMPAYLRANTVLQPVGNIAAEVAAELARLTEVATTQLSVPIACVRTHIAYFENKPDRPALFINVINRSLEFDVEVTHIWIESDPKVHALARLLPQRLRPSESWETWVYLSDTAAPHDLYRMARVRLSTGEVFGSTQNTEVPYVGYVPGGRRT
ncbi:MAG: toll/interleukin-1 receptor domain-containing protein [Burkholderiales bacterium]